MRRLALSLIAACAACSTITRSSSTPLVTIAPIVSDLSKAQQVDHVLNRLAYGPRPGDIERVRAMGLERWIALQLSPERINDAGTDSVVASYQTLQTPTSELASMFREVRMARRDSSRRDDLAGERRRLQLTLAEVSEAKMDRAVRSERQLYEEMVDFWENHFSVFAGKGQTRLFIPAYDREVIRPYAMGKFRDLLGAVAKSPAMLFYLDNAQSVADSVHSTLSSRPLRGAQRNGSRPGLRPGFVVAPSAARMPRGLNENYARELMELHTLGVDGGYTQQDVIEVARALTGWSIDPREGAFVFRPAVHDADAKVVLGSRLSANRGIEDGEEVLDILARHPSTARHITRKLIVRFVSDSPPPSLVDRCAGVFSRSDGDIRETLRCVVTSPEFFSKRAYRSKVKTPFELVASALRATDATPDKTPRSTQIVARLGQPMFGRQTPDGRPDRAEDWVNAGAMVNRVNFGLTLASGRVPGVNVGSINPMVAAMLSTPEFQRR